MCPVPTHILFYTMGAKYTNSLKSPMFSGLTLLFRPEELKKRFDDLTPISRGASNPRGHGKNMTTMEFLAMRGWKENTHWVTLGTHTLTPNEYSSFNNTLYPNLNKVLGRGNWEKVISDTGHVFLFRSEPIASAERIVASVPVFSEDNTAPKRGVVDPYFDTIPDTSGLAVCLPNFYEGPCESDIHRFREAGFPNSRIVAVEKDIKIFQQLCLETRGRIRVIHDIVENYIAEETEPISVYYPDYCGFFNQTSVDGFNHLVGKLTPQARIMVTYSRGRDDGSWRKPFTTELFGHLYKLIRTDVWSSEFMSATGATWIVLFVTQCLGVTTEEFLTLDKLPELQRQLEIRGLHRYTGKGNQGMEFGVFDFVEGTPNLGKMFGNLAQHMTSLSMSGNS